MRFDSGYMWAAAERPEIAAVKRRSYDLLRLYRCKSILDIGCGPGVDTIAMGQSSGPDCEIVGIDHDPAMVDQANSKAIAEGLNDRVRHDVASSSKLPFADGAFDACRCERVLQHLSVSDAVSTVKEAARVTRAGGSIVFVDTDWPSVSVHSTYPVIERKVAAILTMRWANAFAARGMRELLKLAGLVGIEAETHPAFISAPELQLWTWSFVGTGQLSFYEWSIWLDDLKKKEAAGESHASLNLILCHGRKAPREGEGEPYEP